MEVESESIAMEELRKVTKQQIFKQTMTRIMTMPKLQLTLARLCEL